MHKARRPLLYALFLVLILGLGIVFRSFLIANFAGPLAIVFWLILRLLMAVDQQIYWVLIILFAFFQAVRHIPQRPGIYAKYPETRSTSALENVKNWRTFITLTSAPDEINRHNLLRQNLIDLLVSIYAADQDDGAAAYDVYEAIKQQQIPLPEPVYQFLFLEAPARRRSLSAALKEIFSTPQRWIRHWRGQDVAAYHQSIDAVLTFMETALEMKHDDKRSNEPEH